MMHLFKCIQFSELLKDRKITMFLLFACLFVCLTGLSVQKQTRILTGPDSNQMLKSGLKGYEHAGQLANGNVREKRIVALLLFSRSQFGCVVAFSSIRFCAYQEKHTC